MSAVCAVLLWAGAEVLAYTFEDVPEEDTTDAFSFEEQEVILGPQDPREVLQLVSLSAGETPKITAGSRRRICELKEFDPKAPHPFAFDCWMGGREQRVKCQDSGAQNCFPSEEKAPSRMV